MNLKLFIKYSMVILLGMCVAAGHLCSPEDSSVDQHLKEFAQHNETVHDNIDDDYHAHVHKHHEDGEEHEHDHNHLQPTQIDIKLISDSIIALNEATLLNTTLGIVEKHLVSDSYPLGIFRPPMPVYIL